MRSNMFGEVYYSPADLADFKNDPRIDSLLLDSGWDGGGATPFYAVAGVEDGEAQAEIMNADDGDTICHLEGFETLDSLRAFCLDAFGPGFEVQTY